MQYTDLGNQGATNVGENVRYIHKLAVVTINVLLSQACPSCCSGIIIVMQ